MIIKVQRLQSFALYSQSFLKRSLFAKVCNRSKTFAIVCKLSQMFTIVQLLEVLIFQFSSFKRGILNKKSVRINCNLKKIKL